MPMTITEKILAKHAGLKEVRPGQLINAKVDIALGNDITAPIAIKEFKGVGAGKVFDKNKVVLVPDHFTPNKDIKSAEQCKILRNFAKEQKLTHHFEGGEVGIEHALLPEQGIVVPGDLVIGADSHTCTYGALGAFATGVGSTDLAAAMIIGEAWFKVPESMKFIYRGKLNKWVDGKDLILYTIGNIGVDGALYRAMEFCGPVIDKLSMDSRLSMCNMAIEAGGKNGIIVPDKITKAYVDKRAERPYKFYTSDGDAVYCNVREYDCSKIEPQVAFPHLPENTKNITDVGTITIDQVVIGSCTNGRMEDLRIAAKILRGKKVAPYVRLIIIPATPLIYKQAMEEGLFVIYLKAGAIISPPTCGPCLGGHMGILAEGERALATTNRNFVGRMGHPKSEVYLANPAVAAATAVKGRIAHPEEVVRK
ncbi:MAG TPA: 3-isopropylmalate dehydratase large subunit [Deltaproteobacteria bacterium]|nr:MAG: 3-isopropylmalate dehydratase large subunit [Deltaproteobacteria bacterium GWD2_42_10]OGP48912.1 MAG: 3-isopropylmalate dehydratase large subunit [Deltaproteobacteria bacterium GWF2_42_12]OGQ27385.1 MAG: 3-isopropylmalate dehydratase large subunit [Deltaproteobacteria bacterium RIFCSPHIGHO2_02_FULL_42_44]OGQ69459.1 MAG: 3-isopropylmalate dehydratase large subunit [Deltaproteobacteria bacterium RIFCSPLOWO2_12_FULL_42_16]OGQ74488.1 MAG: 3-isopropylmalate dehydratase large subunit [Deltapr